MLGKPAGRKERSPARLHERLGRMGRSGERGDPLVFVGRTNVIEAILDDVRDLPPQGGRGRTFVIDGPPGAGKTALLHEVARRLRRIGRAAIVRNRVPDMAGVRTVYKDIHAALSGGSADDARTTRERKLAIGGGVGPASVERTTTTTLASPEQLEVANIVRLLGRRPFPDDAGGVVFVDEVQNVRHGSPAAGMLEDLHTQNSVPILLVCAGLSTSVERLAEAGISRLDEERIVTLGRLTPDETLDGARRALALSGEWGVVAPDAAVMRWAEAIAGSSDDWPRHLQCYLNAVWKTVAKQEAPNLDTADLDEALARGDELRRSYYNSRLDISKVPINVVGALHDRLARGDVLESGDAVDILGGAIDGIGSARLREDARQQFPRNRDCFNALLRAGLISFDRSRRRVVSPIPSMTRHILDACGGHVMRT